MKIDENLSLDTRSKLLIVTKRMIAFLPGIYTMNLNVVNK